MLENSSDSFALAVMVEDSLAYRGYGGRTCRHKDSSRPSILETAIVISRDNIPEGLREKKADAQLENVSTIWETCWDVSQLKKNQRLLIGRQSQLKVTAILPNNGLLISYRKSLTREVLGLLGFKLNKMGHREYLGVETYQDRVRPIPVLVQSERLGSSSPLVAETALEDLASQIPVPDAALHELASQTLFSEDNLKELASHVPLSREALKALDQAVARELPGQGNLEDEGLEPSVTTKSTILSRRSSLSILSETTAATSMRLEPEHKPSALSTFAARWNKATSVLEDVNAQPSSELLSEEVVRDGTADYLANPKIYVSRLADIRAEVMERCHIKELLEQLENDFWGLETENSPREKLILLQRAMDGTIDAHRYLQKSGFCASEFSIIVQASHFTFDVVKVLPISSQVLEAIKGLIDAVLGSCELSRDRSVDVEPLIGTMRLAALRIFDFVGFVFGTESSPWAMDSDQLKCTVCVVADLVHMFTFGLAFYSGSHAIGFDPEIFPGDGDIESLEFQQIKVERVGLACLRDYIKGPLWVFSKIGNGSEDNQARERGASVLTSIRCLADLWGPARLQCLDKDSDQVLCIDVPGGTICLKTISESLDISHYEDMAVCHWYKWGEPIPDNVLPFNQFSTLLIGVPPWGFTENPNCQTRRLGAALNEASDRVRLEASEPKYELTHKAQFGISKGVFANYGFDLKVIPGELFKTVLAHHWATENTTPDPTSLGLRLGIEISACTGNARRVTLWELFQSETIKEYIRTSLSSELREVEESLKALQNSYGVDNSLGSTSNVAGSNTVIPAPNTQRISAQPRSVTSQSNSSATTFFNSFDSGLEGFLTHWRDNDKFKKSSMKIIQSIIQNISSTGRSVEGTCSTLVAWHAPNALRGLKINNSAPARTFNWLELVGVDNSTEASLCIISKTCLECSGPEGIKCSAQNQGTQTALRTALATLSSFQRREGGKLRKKKKEVTEGWRFSRGLFGHSKQDERALENIHSNVQRPTPEEAVLVANSSNSQPPQATPPSTTHLDSVNIQRPQKSRTRKTLVKRSKISQDAGPRLQTPIEEQGRRAQPSNLGSVRGGPSAAAPSNTVLKQPSRPTITSTNVGGGADRSNAARLSPVTLTNSIDGLYPVLRVPQLEYKTEHGGVAVYWIKVERATGVHVNGRDYKEWTDWNEDRESQGILEVCVF